MTLACLAVVTNVVSAHGSGVSIEAVIDGYLVDIGYSPEFITTERPARFDFLLFEGATSTVSNEVVFTDVWVRIEQAERLLFAGGIDVPVFGAAGMSYQFPVAGEYEVFVRYQDERQALVETSFVLAVTEPPVPWQETEWPLHIVLIGLVLAAILGCLIAIFWQRCCRS